MGNLVKNTHFNELSLSDRVTAARPSESSLMLRNLQSDDKIIVVIGYAIGLLGIPTNLRPDKFGIELIVSFLRTNLPNVTTEQIKTAFDCAVSGRFKVELGLYNQTFSASYITNVLNAYFEYERHLKKPIQGVTTSELTKEQKEIIVINGCNAVFKTYQETVVVDYGNATYNYLDSIGKVDIVTGLKHEFMRQAKEKVLLKLKSDSISIDRGIRHEAKRAIINIEAFGSNEIIVEAKRIALAYVFDGLISENITEI